MGALPRKRSIRLCFTDRAPPPALAMLTAPDNVAPLPFPPRLALSPRIATGSNRWACNVCPAALLAVGLVGIGSCGDLAHLAGSRVLRPGALRLCCRPPVMSPLAWCRRRPFEGRQNVRSRWHGLAVILGSRPCKTQYIRHFLIAAGLGGKRPRV